MALLWIDGFDSYGTTVGSSAQPAGIVGRKYATGSSSLYVRDPRIPGNGRSLATAYYVETPALTTDPTLIVGLGICLSDTGYNGYIIGLRDGSALGIYLWYNGWSGEIEVWRNEGTDVLLGCTSGSNLRRGCWTYVEAKVYCHDTAGTVEVRVNGTTKLSLSGIDTKSGYLTHGYHDKVRLEQTNGFTLYVDDFYVCDATGSKCNDFLGVVKVVTCRPASDVAGKQDWTPQSGTDHCAMLDENPCNDDTDYVESSTSGHLDQFEYGDVSSAGFTALKGVGLCADCRETDANNFTLLQRAEGTSVSEGSARDVAGTSYETHVRVMESDTEGADWTPGAFDATQFGIKVG